jgi:hypothetical protein
MTLVLIYKICFNESVHVIVKNLIMGLSDIGFLKSGWDKLSGMRERTAVKAARWAV